MKMRVLTATNKAKMKDVATLINNQAGSSVAVDVIPPAYSCERERLVVIVTSLSANMPGAFDIFCKDLNRNRATNVALVIDGTAEKKADLVNQLKVNISHAGANVYEEVLYINGGLPIKFLSKIKPEEEQAVADWTARLLENLA
ncbi:MAG: hypothetical protein WDA00_00045 [Eubacteriales bacterium]